MCYSCGIEDYDDKSEIGKETNLVSQLFDTVFLLKKTPSGGEIRPLLIDENSPFSVIVNSWFRNRDTIRDTIHQS